jgi:hypothetical protein
MQLVALQKMNASNDTFRHGDPCSDAVAGANGMYTR